jgi:hypothetical protein
MSLMPKYLSQRVIFLYSAVVFLLPVSNANAQAISYDKDIKSAVVAKLKEYKEQARASIYAQEVMRRFEKANPPSSDLKRHVGIAIALDDALCEAADKPCEPLIYPALLKPEGKQIAITALRRRSDRRPPQEADPNSYVEQFLSGSLQLGATPEFKMLINGNVPASALGDVNMQRQEWIVQDSASISALRQQGPWLFAVSTDVSLQHRRILIYAFPSSLSLEASDKIFSPVK